MGNYVVKFVDNSTGLAHHGIKGQKWGQITKNVGKYYKKGVKNVKKDIAREASKKFENTVYDKMGLKVPKKNKSNDKNNSKNNNKNNKNNKNDDNEKKKKSPYDVLVDSSKDLSKSLQDQKRYVEQHPHYKKTKRLDLGDKTNDQLRKEIDREILEQRYNDVFNSPEVKTGRVKAAAALSAVGTVAVVGTQVIRLAAAYKELSG